MQDIQRIYCVFLDNATARETILRYAQMGRANPSDVRRIQMTQYNMESKKPRTWVWPACVLTLVVSGATWAIFSALNAPPASSTESAPGDEPASMLEPSDTPTSAPGDVKSVDGESEAALEDASEFEDEPEDVDTESESVDGDDPVEENEDVGLSSDTAESEEPFPEEESEEELSADTGEPRSGMDRPAPGSKPAEGASEPAEE